VGAGAFDPKGFSGVVPVFPLPNVILFPGMFLPLHIFEPRYREMTADALRGERLIAMALLKPGWEDQYESRPPVHPVMGMGKIVEHETLKDGRYNLVLLGLVRVRLLQEVGSGSYRTAKVELLEEPAEEPPGYERKRRTLLMLYAELMKALAKGVPQPPDDVPLGMLCDLVSSLIGLDAASRQRLLEELDAGVRCDAILKAFEAPPGAAPGGAARARRPWPPKGPSLN
jgi:Lon protease-like protein